VPCPVWQGPKRGDHGGGQNAGISGVHPNENHAARRGQTPAERDLAEVVVEREEGPSFREGPREDDMVGNAGRPLHHPRHIVAHAPHRLDHHARYVGEQAKRRHPATT